uniref:Uncharacterized protein n=1 Tax=Aplanochytrium stocchinoi TaxID=215587 RepID=A0A7S3PL79_9STRA|mmetsp:Transcript_5665/g.6682  ORF Transcript_5665/g.6682 Transcript_5665/m.6682 type:complete len:244 (+) Transcript_5665:317-1048(+)
MDEDVYAAATSGSVTALKDIVARKGVKALKRKDGDDTSCVHACAEYGHTEVLAYVYDVIDDFEFLRAADCDLRTPLHWAAWRGNLETVKFLAERENVNAKARTGFTPLHYASLGGFEEIVRVLIDAGAKVSLEDQNQQSPIDVAYRFNNEGIAKILEDRRIREIEEAKNDPVKARIEEMNIAAKGKLELEHIILVSILCSIRHVVIDIAFDVTVSFLLQVILLQTLRHQHVSKVKMQQGTRVF